MPHRPSLLHTQVGYHAEPSLEPIHVHIISQDLDAPALKTKAHWNSFATAFFVDAAGYALLYPTPCACLSALRVFTRAHRG